MLGDIKSLSTETYRNLKRLASRLSGGVDPPPEDCQASDAIERNLIAPAHKGTPSNGRLIKANLIENLDC
eukprot:528973-Pyramimonas_sp.AAC.1